MLDLLAIAAFETAISADGKNIRWQVDSENREHGLNPAAIQRDRHANWLVDRFTITRKK
jgi:hypothetical protein